MNRIRLLDGYHWPAEIVQGAKELVSCNITLHDVAGRWEFNSNVFCSFWQDHSDLIVFSQGFVVGVHEINLEGELRLALLILVQMHLSWHIVALVPVGLPLAKDWKSWFDIKSDMVIMSEGMRRTDISDVVIVVEAMDVLRKIGSHHADRVLTLLWIKIWHVVDSRKLSVDPCCLVEDVEILVNCDRSPVRNVDVSASLSEHGKGVREGEEKLDLVERNGRHILVRPIFNHVGLALLRLFA